MGRKQDFRRLVRLSGGVLEEVDATDGWPGFARLNTNRGPVPVAIHVGPVGKSHRARDATERRFQNPGKGRPVTKTPGYETLLLGLWERGERPVVVGMDAEPRIGKTTRQSMFCPLFQLQQAEEKGWSEHYSTSGEHILAFHPELLPVYYDVRDLGTGAVQLSPESIISALDASGFNEEGGEPAAERARRATTQLVRDWEFGLAVVEAYAGHCAMCGIDFRLVQGAHIYPAKAPLSPDNTWNGIAICNNHHAAFDRHLVWVDPDSREIQIHPEITRKAGLNAACTSFVDLTYPALMEPSNPLNRPRAEMFKRRYEFFGGKYNWAA